MSALSIPKPQMEIFPGAYVAKLSMGAAGALGALVIAILSYRTDSAIRNDDGSFKLVMPFTTALGIITFLIEAIILAESTLGEEGDSSQRNIPVEPETAMRTWAGVIWASWLVDVVLATKLSIYGGGSWSASTCSKMGALCAFVWIQWILLTARMIVMLAETARLRFQHMMEALRSKLAPWWKAVKNPFVQILASVGVLLSGVVGSLGMLVTGVVGVVDKGLGVVGLGGIRRKIFDIAGLGKVTSHMDKALSGVGLGGIIGQDESDKQGDGGGGLDQIKESVGLDSSGPDKNETQLAGSSLSNMLGTGKADSEETKSGKTRKRSSKSEKNLD